MMDSSWTHIETPLFPWYGTLNRIMHRANVRPLHGPMVFVASDYAGAHKASWFEAISVLYMDAAASRQWEIERLRVRRQFMADGRRMSFKCLSDRQRWKAIQPFLPAADSITGVCVNLAIRKSKFSLHVDKAAFDDLRTSLPLKGKWRDHELEKMIWVTHLVSFLTGGLSRPGQHIYWISDQDDIFADKSRSADSAALVSGFTGHYVKHPLGSLGVGTTVLDEGDRLEEDLAAIPDLAAGTTADLATKLAQACGGCIPYGLVVPLERRLAQKVDLLCDWLYDGKATLKKVVVVFEEQRDGALSVFRLDSV